MNYPNMVSKEDNKQKHIYKIAYYDTITGLPNNNMLRNELKSLSDKGEKFSLITIDVDDFQKINSFFGYEFGDKTLRKIGEIFNGFVNEKCKLFRWCEDQYVFILLEINDVKDIKKFIDKVQKEISKNKIVIENKEIFVSITAGIAIFPDNETNPDKLFEKADISMYYAKNKTKNSYQIYNSKLLKKILYNIEFEQDLISAVKNDEFVVFYQPQVDIKTEKLIGMEALVRWNKNGNMVSPAEFMPLAEEIGIVIDIDEYVLKTACKQTKLWHDKGYYPVEVSVNLSQKQIENKKLIDTITNILKETEFNSKYLKLEILERIKIQDLDTVVKVLHDLRKIGVKIALDDFGKAYSSLNYLKKLPIDIIKIDKSFMYKIDQDYKERIIMKAIVNLAHDLNLKIIAEGVEKKEHLDFLRSINCDYIQGYYFGKPMCAEQFEEKYLEI